jgi:triosephosphate isomerase (TIM)
MRRPFVAGNWKMNLDRAKSVALAMAVCKDAGGFKDVELAICPPSVYLHAVSGVTAGTNVGLGGQNMYHESGGAFTGEISAAMLQDVGCRYVVLGHSERRHVLGETDAQINLKVHAAINAGLIPIVCVGELLAEREANQTGAVIRRQIEGSLAGLTAEQAGKIVIAYEPVWAIGTGKVASPAQAEETHLDLRKTLAARYTSQIADEIRIQYGGSVKPDNAVELLAQPNVDGALVGGASLKADDFLKIAAAAIAN